MRNSYKAIEGLFLLQKIEYYLIKIKKQFEVKNLSFHLDSLKVQEIYERIFGEEYAQKAVEFQSDLGQNGTARILGKMANGKIKLLLESKGVRIKTPKHEAFHVVFNYLTSDKKQKELLAIAKQKVANQKNKPLNKVTDLEAEEWMADAYGFTSIDKIIKGNKTVWGRFVDWVADFAHRAGLFKNEMEYLFWQIDRGQFRNRPIDFSKEMERLSVEDLDESDIESAQGPNRKYNMQFLISRFGDAQTVDRVANILGSRILANSPIGENPAVKTNSFVDSIKLLQNYYSKERITGDDQLSDGRKVSEIKPKEILRIFNESNPQDIRKLADYMLQNKDIFEALIEKILPGVDLDDLSIKKEGEDTISDDKSLADFRKKTNPYIKFALMRVPVRQYKKSGTGYVRSSDQVLGMADFNDLQYSIMKAVKYLKKDSTNILYDPIGELREALIREINQIGHNTKRGMALASFVDTFFVLDPKTNSISKNMLQAYKDGNIERYKFIAEFMNGMVSQFFSLREKTAIDFNVYGYDSDKTVKRVEFSGVDSSRFKNEIKAAVRSITTDNHDRVKDKVIEKLEKDYVISEFGIKSKNGDYIIKLESGSGIDSKYVFVDNPKLNSDVRKLMNLLGLKNFNGAAFNFMMKDISSEDYSMDLYFTGMIKDKMDNRVARFNSLKEYFADSIAKMIFSAKHNHEFFKEAAKKLDEMTPQGYEGGNILEDKGIDAKKFYQDLLEKSFGYKILDGYLHNVDAVNLDEADNPGADTRLTPYTVFKPFDFYKFFEVLSEVKDFTSGSGGVSFFYRPDGKKEYVYGLSSNIFDTIGDTIFKAINKINSEKEYYNSDSILYDAEKSMQKGELVPYNLLLRAGTKHEIMRMNGLREIKGIKHGALKKGTTKPNLGNFLTIGLNEFLESVSSGTSRQRMSFLTTNLGDSGYMYAANYEFSGGQSFLRNISRKDFKGARVNNDSLNAALYSVFQGLIREYEVSNRRWDNMLATAFPGQKIYDPDLEPHQQHNQINNFIKKMNEETYRAFETMVLASNMVMNFDYQFEDGKIQLGKATTGMIDPATGNPNVDIYNIGNAKGFMNAMVNDDGEATEMRRKIFRDAYLNYVSMLNKNGVMVSKQYKNIEGFENGRFKANEGSDWNPVLEAMFMGSHITNASLNALWLGSFSQYAGYSTTDQSKRSKPFTTPGTTAGKINTDHDKYSMGERIKVAIITDTKLAGDGSMEQVYNDNVDATDGIGFTNPLALEFINHSFGGQFGVLDQGMMKPITSYVDPHTGMAIQLKQSEHPISFQVYSKSLTARRMMHEFLAITHPDLPRLFNEWYNSAGGGEIGWKNAMKNSIEFVADNRLQKNLVWQFVNLSAVKTGAHKINQYHLDSGFANPAAVQTIDIDTSQIRNILNPYQDFNDNERMAPPTQMLAIMGIGAQNKQRINGVNNAMKLIFTKGVGQVLDKLFDGGENAVRDLMLKAADSMSTMSDFAELVANNNISLDLPMLSEKMQQIIANQLTKHGQKKKFAGLRANQAPGHILDIYEFNGQIYMLDELERMGLALVNPDFTVQLSEGITKRKLRPMTNGNPAEVVVPFMYMKKFGVRPEETLNDIYLIHLKDGSIINVFGKKPSQIRKIVEDNFDMIDAENTPMMRAMNGLVEKAALKAVGTDEDQVQKFNTLGEIMTANKALMDLKAKLLAEENENGEKTNGFNRKNFIASKVCDYFDSLEQSLNLFGVRIPTSNAGSGFHGRVVGFVNDMGNIVYTSELKNILDGSDYDIDQLSLFTRFINDDFTMPAENSVEGLQNYVVNELMNMYSDAKNHSDIFVKLSLKRLKKLADEVESKKKQYINDPASAAMDYFINMQGRSIFIRLTNTMFTYSYLNHLPSNIIHKNISWASTGINIKIYSDYSLINALGTFLLTSLKNADNEIFPRIGIYNDSIDIIGVMIVSGMNQEEIANFFKNPIIRDIYHHAQKGYGIENSRFDFSPYVLTTKRLTMLKKEGVHEFDQGKIDAEYTLLRDSLSQMMIDSGYAVKENGKYVFNEEGFYTDYVESREVINRRNELWNNKKKIEELHLLIQLKEYLEKGEMLRRISHVVTLRKGFKAVSSDFEFYKNSLEEYLGMEIKDFANKEAYWNKTKHLAFFVTRNNDARFGDSDHKKAAMDMENALLDMNFNLFGIVKSLPQFDEYIKRLRQLDDYFNKHILFRSRAIQEWAREYLLEQEQTKWHSSGHRQTFYNELGRFFLSVHFSNKYKGEVFDLALSTEGVSAMTTLKDIRIDSPEGRTMFALQFPQFVMALKSATEKGELAVKGGTDYGHWFEALQRNQFIDRLVISGNNEERGFLALQDSFNLDSTSIYKLKSEFQKLPVELQEMFEIYEMIVNGFEDHKGSIKKVMGHKLLEDVSRTFDGIKTMIKNPNSEFHTTWKKNFLKALPHAEGMARYYSNKDRERGAQRAVVQVANPDPTRSKFQNKIIARLTNRYPIEYEAEFLRTSRLGIPYDPYRDITTTFEPVHGLTAGEMDKLLIGQTLTKDFVYGHSYSKTETLSDRTSVRRYYILPNGKYVTVSSMNNFSVTFKVVNEYVDETGRKIETAKERFSMESVSEKLMSYTGTLTAQKVEEGAEQGIVFVRDGFLFADKDNKFKRDTINAMENVVVVPFKNARSKSDKARFIKDESDGSVNVKFKNAVDRQIAILKKAMAEGKKIAFPKYGATEMEKMKDSKSIQYLVDQFKEKLGIEFQEYHKMTIEERLNLLAAMYQSEQGGLDYDSDLSLNDDFVDKSGV